MFDYDVVIAGASIAGATLALKLAREGVDIALVEMKPRERLGEKTCGDGISASYFEQVGIAPPSGEELATVIKRSEVYAPDMKHSLVVLGSGYIVNRKALTQRLVREAEAKGVHVLTSTAVVRPLISGGKVTGVVVRDARTGELREVRAKVTVDATGVAGAIRSKLPPGLLAETRVELFDFALAYREIVEVENADWRTDTIYIYLSHKLAPGGYCWLFPKGANVANIGVGIQPLEGAPDVRELFKRFLERRGLRVARVLDRGAGLVPVRRPLAQLVTDGLVLVGDSACQANPLHGGGMGYAMVAAKMAAEVIAEHLDRERVASKEELWEYAVKFMRTYGSKCAALEVVRLALQGMRDEEINYLISKGIVSGADLLAIEARPGEVTGVWKRILEAIFTLKLGLFRRLKLTRDLCREVSKLYREYPDSPRGLADWKRRVDEVIKEAREKLWRNPLEHTYAR